MKAARNHDALDLAWKRVLREAAWSLVIVFILTSGLIAWILIPSVASSLQSGVSNYSNGLGTYIVIDQGFGQPVGSCEPIFQSCALSLPQNVTSKVASIPGVEEMYPLILNGTIDTSPCWSIDSNTGKNITYSHCYETTASGLLGGPDGFPPSLIALSQGRYPSSSPQMAISQLLAPPNHLTPPWKPNATKPIAIGCYGCVHTSSNPIGNVTNVFNATIVGVMSLNPLFNRVDVIWNSTFMLQKLGPTLFRQTWGGNGSNFVIIKADNVADIPRIANQTSMILAQNPLDGNFAVVYNQALSQSLQSFQSQTAPLYELIGGVSLVAVAGVSFLLAQLIARRREWEAGVYLTQGWSWRELFWMYSIYFLFLSLISFIVAAGISFEASRYFSATYAVLGTSVTLTASLDPLYLFSGLAFAVLLAFFASYVIVRRQRTMGLDKIVREY